MVGQENVTENNSGLLSDGASRLGRLLRKVGAWASPPAIPLWKRTLDLGMIVLLAPAILPVCLVVALIVKLGSKGPLLFRQPRVGYKGRQFVCFKFRTMQSGAETESHKSYTQELIRSEKPMEKLDNHKDPRVIRFGGRLRAGGLDELAQLLNVIRGEMSLVGPRPCLPYEYEMYEPRHCRRLEAAPGLTGLWQVSGKNRTTFEQMVDLDIRYAESKTLWLDLKIILWTLPVILTQCGDLIRRKRERASRSASASLGRSIPSFRL